MEGVLARPVLTVYRAKAKRPGGFRAFVRLCEVASERQAVRSRAHAKQHRNGENKVGARGVEGGLARLCLLLVRGLHDAEDFLLIRPDEDPHIEQHDRAQPCTDADDETVGALTAVAECESLRKAAAVTEVPHTCKPCGHSCPTEPEQGTGRDV